jgi:hypothetical protein
VPYVSRDLKHQSRGPDLHEHFKLSLSGRDHNRGLPLAILDYELMWKSESRDILGMNGSTDLEG